MRGVSKNLSSGPFIPHITPKSKTIAPQIPNITGGYLRALRLKTKTSRRGSGLTFGGTWRSRTSGPDITYTLPMTSLKSSDAR